MECKNRPGKNFELSDSHTRVENKNKNISRAYYKKLCNAMNYDSYSFRTISKQFAQIFPNAANTFLPNKCPWLSVKTIHFIYLYRDFCKINIVATIDSSNHAFAFVQTIPYNLNSSRARRFFAFTSIDAPYESSNRK